MCVPIISAPKAPAIPEPPKVIEPPKPIDIDIKKARDDERRRARASFGQQRTILTSGNGLGYAPSTAKKSLLGE